MPSFLARLRHDLLKQALWCARDLETLRQAGQPTVAADRRALRRSLLELVDSEGRAATALMVWRELRGESSAPAAALDDFERAVVAAETAVQELANSDAELSQALVAVRQLEEAFSRLAQHLRP